MKAATTGDVLVVYKLDRLARSGSFLWKRVSTLDFDSMEKYLHKLITVDGIMYSTFNRRAAGITFYLSSVLNLEQTALQKKRLQIIRQLYNTEEYLRLKPIRGVRAEKQEEVIALIKFDYSIYHI